MCADDFGSYDGLVTVLHGMGAFSEAEWQEITADWDDSDNEDRAETATETQALTEAPALPSCS